MSSGTASKPATVLVTAWLKLRLYTVKVSGTKVAANILVPRTTNKQGIGLTSGLVTAMLLRSQWTALTQNSFQQCFAPQKANNIWKQKLRIKSSEQSEDIDFWNAISKIWRNSKEKGYNFRRFKFVPKKGLHNLYKFFNFAFFEKRKKPAENLF